MPIGAARVMAAGKAGMESLPYFVDELLAQGIPQLAPWAIDHEEGTGNRTDLTRLKDKTQSRLSADWRDIFEMKVSPPGVTMSVAGMDIRVLLQQINPLAAKQGMHLADSPSHLGVWCRLNLKSHCHSTYQMWQRYKAHNGLDGKVHQLAVVIPYCPEGPTSGTVGMYLGAALRKYFADNNQSDELVVWGIEICPPLGGENDSRHLYRGYVARQELLEGVPLSENADDDKRYNSFDINIVFDGGLEREVSSDSSEYIHEALDRAAAQTTACLLNGAGDQANMEAHIRLILGGRWNAYLMHVVSERSYGQACRYLNYQVTLPWHRAPETWVNGSIEARRSAFLRRVEDDIQSRLEHEVNDAVKEQVGRLVKIADGIKDIPLDAKVTDIITKRRRSNLDLVRELLNQAVDEDGQNYRDASENERAPAHMIPRRSPFCINIAFPEDQRREAALRSRDGGIPAPVLDILGDAGIGALHNSLTQRFLEILERSDCNPYENNSSAFFDQIISVPIGSSIGNGRSLGIAQGNLHFLLAADRRFIPDMVRDEPFDLEDAIVRQTPDDSTHPKQPVSLKWKLSSVPHDVPVEYSHLILAEVREGDGFKDMSAYNVLESTYLAIKSDPDQWKAQARYYGVKPPSEWSADEKDELHSADDPSASDQGQPLSQDAVEESI